MQQQQLCLLQETTHAKCRIKKQKQTGHPQTSKPTLAHQSLQPTKANCTAALELAPHGSTSTSWLLASPIEMSPAPADGADPPVPTAASSVRALAASSTNAFNFFPANAFALPWNFTSSSDLPPSSFVLFVCFHKISCPCLSCQPLGIPVHLWDN